MRIAGHAWLVWLVVLAVNVLAVISTVVQVPGLPPTASPVKIFWSLIYLFGVTYAARGFYDTWGDLRSTVRDTQDEGELETARGEVSDSGMILIALAAGLLVGLISFFALPAQTTQESVSFVAIVAPIALIVGAEALIYLTYSRRRRRGVIFALIQAKAESMAIAMVAAASPSTPPAPPQAV